MVKLFNKSHELPHPWTNVTQAIWQKYPNPFATHVLSSDVLERSIDSAGMLHTTRVFRKAGRIPAWGSKLFNIKEAYIIETSIVDPSTQTMSTTTRNMSHVKLLLVEDVQVIKGVGPHTVIDQVVKVVSNTAFLPIRGRIEGWGLDRVHKSSTNSLLGLLHVLKTIPLQKSMPHNT